MGFADSDACKYFDKLTESLVEERMNSTDRDDFLQTLTNNLVDVDQSSTDMLRDEAGISWTRKGMIVCWT